MKLLISPRKFVVVLGVIIIALTIISFAAQFYKYLVMDGKDRYILKMFFLDAEFNIPTWYAAIALVITSCIASVIYLLKKTENDKFKLHWLGLGIIFFLLATDEILVLHEQIISPLRNMLGTSGFLYMAWIIPAIIFVIIFVFAYYKFLFSLPVKTRNRFIIAGIIFISGAVGLEAVGGNFLTTHGQNNLIYTLITNVEEFLEMCGVWLFINSLLSYIKSKYPELNISFKEPEKRSDTI